jgi:uncharacterized RDD family membrane protein YckC
LGEATIKEIFVVTTSSSEAADVRYEAWLTTGFHPWRRFLARTIDYLIIYICSLVLSPIVVIFLAYTGAFTEISQQNVLFYFYSTFILLMLMAEAILLASIGLTGFSPCKYLFGVRILRKDGRPMGVWRTFKRELIVFTLGMGWCLYVPFIFQAAKSFVQLQNTGTTAWDKDKNIALYRPPGRANRIGFAVGILVPACFAAWRLVQMLS